MAKKKQNPNKIPINLNEVDLDKIRMDATNRTVLRVWALVLVAIADFKDTTVETLREAWHVVNLANTKINSFSAVKLQLQAFEKRTGVAIPLYPAVGKEPIRTQGELARFIRRTDRYALSSAYAILSEPMLTRHLFSDEKIGRIFQKAVDMNEELENGQITLDDLLEVLRDEYGVILEETEKGTRLLLEVRDDEAVVSG